MEELHECIILMRSYFSRDNSDLSKEIEKALNSTAFNNSQICGSIRSISKKLEKYLVRVIQTFSS